MGPRPSCHAVCAVSAPPTLCCVAVLNSGFIFIISLLTPPCVSLLPGPCLHVLRAGGFGGLSVTAAPHRTLWSPGAPVIRVLCSLPGPHVPVILLFSDLPFFFFSRLPPGYFVLCYFPAQTSRLLCLIVFLGREASCWFSLSGAILTFCTVGAVWGAATSPR